MPYRCFVDLGAWPRVFPYLFRHFDGKDFQLFTISVKLRALCQSRLKEPTCPIILALVTDYTYLKASNSHLISFIQSFKQVLVHSSIQTRLQFKYYNHILNFNFKPFNTHHAIPNLVHCVRCSSDCLRGMSNLNLNHSSREVLLISQKQCGSINGDCSANGCDGTTPSGGPGFCTQGQFAGCQCGNNCNGSGPCGSNSCNGEIIDGQLVCTSGEFVGCSCN